MEKEIMGRLALVFLLLALAVLFIGSPIYTRYKINKFNKDMQEQEITRTEFIMQFPEKLKEYGYDSGKIPDFLATGEYIYLEDGKNNSIIYKTDMELNEIERFDILPTSYPQSVKFKEDGSKLFIDDKEYDLSTKWDVSTAKLIERRK